MILFVPPASSSWYTHYVFQVWTSSYSALLFSGTVLGNPWTCLYLCAQINPLHRILAISLLHTQSVTVCQVMSFLARPNFVPVAMHILSAYVLSFRVTYWTFIIHWLIYFVHLPFFSWSASTPGFVSPTAKYQSPVISPSLCDYHYRCDTQPMGFFIFRVLGHLYPLVMPHQILCVEFI